MRRTEGTEVNELMRATMIVEAIDGTIAALRTQETGNWQAEVARLEQLRAQTLALAREWRAAS